MLLAKRYKGRLDSDADDFIHYAVDGIERMRNLIRDLLEYSCLGGRQMKPEQVDCNAIAAQAVGALKSAIEQAAANVHTDTLPIVRGDPSHLGLVFQNLLANALKFRNKNAPRIRISAKQQDREWLFSVNDNGIGIEPQYVGRIFEIFQRLHTQEEYPGTGIGLAICKRIIEAHGGRIWTESVPGKGSTFYFTIPRPSPEGEIEPQPKNREPARHFPASQ